MTSAKYYINYNGAQSFSYHILSVKTLSRRNFCRKSLPIRLWNSPIVKEHTDLINQVAKLRYIQSRLRVELELLKVFKNVFYWFFMSSLFKWRHKKSIKYFKFRLRISLKVSKKSLDKYSPDYEWIGKSELLHVSKNVFHWFFMSSLFKWRHKKSVKYFKFRLNNALKISKKPLAKDVIS